MLWALERSHDLSQLSGLIVGQFTSMKDNDIPFGSNIHQIFLQHFEKYGIPVCFDFPGGHEESNFSIILGSSVIMDIKLDNTGFEFLK
jgi:muramoyltetrapeptide carboxypeptidase